MNPRDFLQALLFISWFVFIGFGDHNFLLHFTSSISTTIYFHSILNHIDITWKWILLAQNKELKNHSMNNRKGKWIISCDMNQARWKECSAPSWKQVSTEGLMIFKFYTMNTFPFIFLIILAKDLSLVCHFKILILDLFINFPEFVFCLVYSFIYSNKLLMYS